MSLKPLEQKGVDLIWKAWRMPQDAKPSPKPEGYGEHAKKYLGNLLNKLGLELLNPNNKSDTYLAHIGAKYAKEQGYFNQYNERVFEAVWKYGESIGDKKVLVDIAKEAGLNPIDFEDGLTNPSYIDQVEADFKLAFENQIWTIPSYIGARGTIQVHHFQDLPTLIELEKIIF